MMIIRASLQLRLYGLSTFVSEVQSMIEAEW